jgi:hypothetical protein
MLIAKWSGVSRRSLGRGFGGLVFNIEELGLRSGLNTMNIILFYFVWFDFILYPHYLFDLVQSYLILLLI